MSLQSTIKKTQAVKKYILLYLQISLLPCVIRKMSIYNLATLSNDNLKKLARECTSFNDVYYECGRPKLLKKEEECTREVDAGLEGYSQDLEI